MQIDPDLDLSQPCASCGHELMSHTMHFDRVDGEEFIRVNTDQPLKCPLGQLSDWISWDEALPVGVASG